MSAPAESLQTELDRVRRELKFCREQRDQLACLVNDLHLEIAMLRPPPPDPPPTETPV